MAEYTPTTERVEDQYRHARRLEGDGDKGRAEFARWLAAHDESVRAAERERIARDIEVKMRQHDRAQVGFSAIGDAYADAARIAREGVGA